MKRRYEKGRRRGGGEEMKGLTGKIRAVMHLGMPLGRRSLAALCWWWALRSNLSRSAHTAVLLLNRKILRWPMSALSKAVLTTS